MDGYNIFNTLNGGNIVKKLWLLLLLIVPILLLTGCESEADVASKNVSKSADMFEVNRRIVFYNGITDEYILVVEGLCSLGNFDSAGELSVTCKTGPSTYKKHFLGLSDNVTYFAEQMEPASINSYQYRVVFRPAQLIPDIEVDLP
jgi:hypothetical protein